MKSIFILIILSFFAGTIYSQTFIKGKVTDAVTGKELPSVSIFINNSSIGTISDEHGNFTLKVKTGQRLEIIASSIGYESVVENISPENISQTLFIKMKQKSAEMEQVIVQSYEKDGWNKWGKTFTDYLIGTGRSSAFCTIKNSNVVRFIFDKNSGMLTAFTSEPLIIENKYLGYQLVYDLQNFVFDQKRRTFFFLGFPFFKDINGTERKDRKWQERRQYAYEGSILHFMRALYRNILTDEGFTMNILDRTVNKEKERIEALYKKLMRPDGRVIIQNQDSFNYYGKILSESDSLDFIHPSSIASDSVAYGYDSTTTVFNFTGHLQITYTKKKEVPDGKSFYAHTYTWQKPKSIISFITAPSIFVYADGSYFEAANILNEGYWAWSEKLSNLLPTDYKYEK